ncbi:rhomboid family intramembrane serine protease [Lactobacillus sp. S2-2]|uniref:rhomboid family intramembrane serine protease n=1 Tax=Lactobacillus sp. S2-2 TaxID=2692917 RepID=UPI001F3D0981|nr:rhomboid family intramembrane serine protease [Lactobacillus sp. S2-2]MCF6515123.1 rhomboid family intramembrane serine protease [Lactobacillus sp. S2-2]
MLFVYLLMSLNGGSENPQTLVKFGALYPPAIMNGEWWRLITPIFIHIGITHLILNLVTIYFIGIIIEREFGHFKYLLIFIISGILGNLTSLSFTSGLSAGASTSIFGLFGSFFMVYESYKENTYIRNTAKSFFYFLAFNFIYDLFIPGIDLWGHIGGIIAGFLISYVVGLKEINKKIRIKRLISTFVLIAVIIILLKVSFLTF